MDKRTLAWFSALSILVASPLHAAPVHRWSKHFGTTLDQSGNSIATDGSYNVVVTGELNGSADFGGGTLTSAGSSDVFLAKFDIDGYHLWSKRFGDGAAQIGNGVDADASGNIAITGTLAGAADFGGGPLTSAGGTDVFVARFDPAGSHSWSARFGDGSNQAGTAVTIDGSGDVIVTGTLAGTADFGGGPLTSAGGLDVFVAKFSPAGAYLWSRRYGAALDQISHAITTDASDRIVIAGELNGTTDFGGGPLASAGNADAFVLMLDANGNHVWSQRYGSTMDQIVHGVSIDGAGNVLVAGEFRNTIDFGGGTLTSAGGSDIFVAKLYSDGTHVWSRRFGSGGNQTGLAVTGYGSGGVAITGQFGGTVDFGGGPLTSGGGQDAFLVKLDATGTHVWSQRFGDGNTEVGNSVAVDGWGDVSITGRFSGIIDFGGGPMTSAGGFDGCVAKFVDEDLVPVLITRFDARNRGAAVEVTWQVSSDEALSRFVLYRRDDLDSPAVVAQGPFDPRSQSYLDDAVVPGRTYRYELVLVSSGGDEFRSPEATVTVTGSADALGQNFPNPFNPVTVIEYTLAERGPAALGIYDVTGKRVVRLDQGIQDAGTHRVEWRGRDARGLPVASGVYFYRLEGVPRLGLKRMVLLK